MVELKTLEQKAIEYCDKYDISYMWTSEITTIRNIPVVILRVDDLTNQNLIFYEDKKGMIQYSYTADF